MTEVSGTPIADALASVDKAMADGFAADGTTKRHQVVALHALAEAVRASLTKFSEGDVRALAETAAELEEFADYAALTDRQCRVLDRAATVFGTDRKAKAKRS